MKKTLIAALVAIAFVSAQAAESPQQLLKQGVDAYMEEGANEAIKAWLEGSPIEGEKTMLMQASNLSQIDAIYGPLKGYQLVELREVTDRIKQLYFVLYHENGPVFGVFTTYRNETGEWVLPYFKVHTEMEMVWPGDVGLML